MNRNLLSVLALAALLSGTAWAGCGAALAPQAAPAPAAPAMDEAEPAAEPAESCPVCGTGFIDEMEWQRLAEDAG